MEKEKHSKKPIGKIIGFSILGIIGAWLLLTVVVPLVMGDGLGNYSGEQRDLAEDVLNNPGMYIDNKSRWAYPLHIKEIHQATAEEQKEYCSGTSHRYSRQSSRYTVILEIRHLFTFNTNVETHVGCAGWVGWN